MSNAFGEFGTPLPPVPPRPRAEAPSGIAGHRQLSASEVLAINALKAKATEIGAMLECLKAAPDIDQRALAIAKTELQTGFMWAVRAIARPTGF